MRPDRRRAPPTLSSASGNSLRPGRTTSSRRWPGRPSGTRRSSPGPPSRRPATGSPRDKVRKNLFAARNVHAFIRPMKTVGVIARHEDPPRRRDRRAVRPGRGHRAVDQSYVDCHLQAADRAQGALRNRAEPASGRPGLHHADRRAPRGGGAGGRCADGAISWLTTVTVAGTQTLMRRREIAVILATGGLGLVRAAYSAASRRTGSARGTRPRTSSSPQTWRRRCATSSPARPSTTACSAPPRTP